MLPIIATGLKIGMGAIAGHKMAMRVMRPSAKKTLGQLPPVGVALPSAPTTFRFPHKPNFANGMHFIQNAKVFVLRGDLQNSAANIDAAWKAATGLNTGLAASLAYTANGGSAAGVKAWINNYLRWAAKYGVRTGPLMVAA